jgi:nucleoid-associated protein YgaU
VAKEEEVGIPGDYQLTGDGVKTSDESATADQGLPLGDSKPYEPEVPSATDALSTITETTSGVVDSTKADRPKKAKRMKKPKADVEPASSQAGVDSGSGGGEGEGRYVVHPGDTLGKISRKIYGSRRSWGALAQFNGFGSKKIIYPGDVIRYEVTDRTRKFHQVYTNDARLSVTVRKHDTLSRIAKRVYGDARYWRTLWKQNDVVQDPNRIEVGQTLYYADMKRLSRHSKGRKSVRHSH